MIRVDEPAERAALTWLRRHDERDYSFVDATSFEVMRRERMTGRWRSTGTSRPQASSS